MMSLVDPPAPSIVEADLAVSWNTGAAKRYWYRVEGVCGPATCENMGVGFDGCNDVLLLTTVSAGSVAELCDVLANPRTNAPVMTQIVSIRKYSRPVFKADIQPDQCNVLEPVEFCQIPECFDFCPQPASMASHDRPLPVRPRRASGRPRSADGVRGLVAGPYGFPLSTESGAEILSAIGMPIFGVMETPYTSEFEFGSEEETFPLFTEYYDEFLSESGEQMLGETSVPSPATPGLILSGSAEVSCTFFAHDSSGSIEAGGFAYFVSPRGTFVGSGSVSVSGRGYRVFSLPVSGGVVVSGSAALSRSFVMLGGVELSGSSDNESPDYSYDMSGLASLSGSAGTNFSSLGTIEITSAIVASAFGFGTDSLEPTTASSLSISSFSVSACGCTGMGPTVTMRHNLANSLAFSRFLTSGGLSYPESLPLRHRSSDNMWSSMDYLVGRTSRWAVSMSMQCQADSWRLSLGVSENQTQTKLVMDIPADVICGEGYFTTSIVAYFNPYAPSGSGERIQVVTPDKSRYLSVVGDVEVFVNGIFVPQTVYYDGLGLFKDQYWGAAPLEIDLNPIARNKSVLQDISWV